MKYRVLLADDNTAILPRVTTILSPEFDVVGRVTDGQALVEATVRLQPDLVLVDISMPKLNGCKQSRTWWVSIPPPELYS